MAEGGFGGSVKLTGESEYRQSIEKITKDLQSMSVALKDQTADFNSNDKSLLSTAKSERELAEALKAQQTELAKAKSAYAQYAVEVQTQTQRHNALSREYNKAVAELDRLGKTAGTTSEEYQKQAEVVDKLGKELADSNESLNESKQAMSALKSEINTGNKVIAETEAELNGLGKEAKGAGDKAKEGSDGFTVMKGVLADLASSAIKAVLSGLVDLGKAFIDVGRQAVGSFAEFEQLEGGVKKLFGTSAESVEEYAQSVGKSVDEVQEEYDNLLKAQTTVMENAQEAYKTAGMDANTYMNTVTNFSASLIDGLGGDTVKASQIADQAIRDMADNANTFGTSIESIQNAYQGFAKGNFTMLDNLKLGYGGTKTEMLRLVKDAGVVDKSVKSLDDVTFDQMIEAIHIVQTNMNITGTTAREASYTIDGATKSMKSAWQNMLTGLAQDDADFTKLAESFMDTLITADGKGGYIGQLVPRITSVITGIGTAIQTMLPMIINQIVPLIQESLPVIMQAVQDVIWQIMDVLPMLLPVVTDLIMQLVNMAVSMLPQVVVVGVKLVLSLLDGIKETVPELLKMLPSIISDMVDVLMDNLPEIIQTGMDLILGLIEGLMEALPQLIDYVPTLIETIVTVLLENLPMIVDSAVKIMVALINGLIESLPKLIAMIPKIVLTIVDVLIKNLPLIIEGGVKIIASLISGIMQSLGTLAMKAKEIGQTIIEKVKELPSKMLEVGKDLVRGIWEGISNSFAWIKSKIKGWVGDVLKFIKKLFGIASPSKVFRDQIGANLALGIGEGFSDEMKEVSREMSDSIPKSFDVSTSLTGAGRASSEVSFNTMVSAFKEALSQMKIELDDDEVGRFIDRTVTRLVYA